jgi:hypothetical protein
MWRVVMEMVGGWGIESETEERLLLSLVVGEDDD